MQQVEGLHQSTPSRMPAAERDAEADVEGVPAAHREHRADQHVPIGVRLPERPGRAGEQDRPADRPAEQR